jgi:hypothetical protein
MTPYLWIVFLDYRNDMVNLLTVPPTMSGNGPRKYQDVIAILESNDRPGKQRYPLEGRGMDLKDLKGRTHLVSE